MSRVQPPPLPEFTPERLLDRIAEAVQVGLDPGKLRQFPLWTRRVMAILKHQFVPHEFSPLLTADGSILAEGIAVAWVAKARDLAAGNAHGEHFADKLAGRLAMDDRTRDVAVKVAAGQLDSSDEFQKHVMSRLFAANFDERRAFVEGLAIGNRLPELLDRQALQNRTDATGIYLVLWFYWPEISKLNSIAEVARVLEPFFSTNKNLAGAHWDERIRKLSNRLGLSFRAKQVRRRARAGPR